MTSATSGRYAGSRVCNTWAATPVQATSVPVGMGVPAEKAAFPSQILLGHCCFVCDPHHVPVKRTVRYTERLRFGNQGMLSLTLRVLRFQLLFYRHEDPLE
jgi:hypothetical protein